MKLKHKIQNSLNRLDKVKKTILSEGKRNSIIRETIREISETQDDIWTAILEESK